jgi:hypothetical protein
MAHLLLVSQKVKDIKLPKNGQLEKTMGRFRKWLVKHSFLPSNKVPANVKPVSLEDGVLLADISGVALSSDLDTTAYVRQRFPIAATEYNGPMDVEKIFASVKGASVDDGGNIQNMIVDLVTAVMYARHHEAVGRRQIRVTIASSSDPFVKLPTELAEEARQFCELYALDIPDRFSIQVPFEDDNAAGTLAINSEPLRTNEALRRLVESDEKFGQAFRKAHCFVSADPIYDVLAGHATPPYATIINASTAFRSLTAAESYNRTVLLPMNNGEAEDVCRLLLQRGLEEELGETESLPFESPLSTSEDAIDMDALESLDRSVDLFLRYVPVGGHPSITCPITFGPDGGMVIGRGHEHFACFTSTLTREGERILFEEFAVPERMVADLHEVGAGDSAATVIALFNAIHPKLFLSGHMEGREAEHHRLVELASTIFVCMLGRISGSFLLHTTDTYWSNIRRDRFAALLDEAARASLELARTMVKKLHAPVMGEIKKWGIKVVAWKPGSVAYPDATAL